mgnify:FL=1
MSTFQENQKAIDEYFQGGGDTERPPEVKKQEGLSLIETLSIDDNYGIIKDYMSDRFGMEDTEYDKREIIDSYINQMRKFNAGQSVVAVTELTHLNSGEGDKLDARRAKAAKAYELFDSLGGAFSKDRTVGEKLDAVGDYARAIVVDPINLVSLGVGKLFAAGGARAAVQGSKKLALIGAKDLAFRAGRLAANNAAKQGLKKSVVERIQRETTQRAFQEALKKSKRKVILDKADRKSVYRSLKFDIAAAGLTDYVQQKAEVTSGFKDELDFFQTGLSALTTGLVGGGLAQAGFVYSKKLNKDIPLASIELDRSSQIQKSLDDSLNKLSKKDRKKILASADVNKALLQLKENTTKWAQKVADGKELAKVSDDPKASIDYDTEFAVMFFNGKKDVQLERADAAGFEGLVQILAKAGYKRPPDMRFTHFLGEAFGDLSKENKDIVLEAYDILKQSSEQLKNYSFEEFIKIDAAATSKAGQILQIKAQGQELMNKLGLDEPTPEQIAQAVIDPIDQSTFKKVVGKLVDFQSLLIRSIVTHPGTTGLNVIGWKAATVNQSISDMLRAGLYSGNAMINLVRGDAENAVKYKKLAVSMMDLQRQKVRNMVNPYGTKDTILDFLAVRPEAQRELFRYLNGGVEVKGILDEFELNPANIKKKTGFQRYNDLFETLYAVKAQDFFTKTQEFAYAIDKQVRLKYGKTFAEFLQDDELVKYLSQPGTEMFKEFAEIEARAVQDALRNTFSKKYGGNDGYLQFIAKGIEEVRQVPGIGALAPFGQFWNNSVAFMLDHSGISLANKYVVRAGGEAAQKRDTLDLITKSAIGYGALTLGTISQIKNLEEGLAWYEDRDDSGAVRSYLYDYPRNVPMLVGRMFAHKIRDDEIPLDLKKAFIDNFGIRALTRDLGDSYGAIAKGIDLAFENQDEEFISIVARGVGEVASQYISGFSRRFEPVNQTLAMARGEDYEVVDKKQGVRWINDSLRYTDEIFDWVLSLTDAEEARELLGKGGKDKKEKALSGEPMPVPIGKIVGYREVQPSSTIEKLFNDIGRPNWNTGIRNKSPEAINHYNKYVRPQIEMLADVVLYNNDWDSMSLKDKQNAVKAILRVANTNTKKSLKKSLDPDEKKTSLIFSIKGASSKQSLRKAMKYFDVSEKDLFDLDVNQLYILEDMVKRFQKDIRGTGKRLGIE